ncbi:hypothetical protein L0Y65_04260 [Candidatus Micrarchaeota archaeon]|nr:hypothetical protein [Candidatus Micrarchaeota archaeon]
MKGRELILLGLAAVLAIGTIAFLALFLQSSSENKNLRAELAATKANLSSAQYALGMREDELERKNGDIGRQQEQIGNLSLALAGRLSDIEELRERLNESEAELEKTKNTLAEAEEDIARIREEAIAMDGQISESIQWFRDNSALPSTLKTDRFMNKVEKNCEKDDTLNLACVSYLMEEELGFVYKDDPTGDRLYSIDEIIARKGGDCEDYSLFFKAFLNGIRQEDLGIEAFTAGAGKYVVYEDAGEGRYWYYEDSEGVAIGNAENSNPYSVCYFFETQGATRIGHCLIMLTNRTIDSPDDITNANLAGSALFEPQDGRYMGGIGEEFTVCEDGDSSCGMRDYALAFIITDADLYHFSEGKWNYYEGRKEELGALLESLERVELGYPPR